MPVVGVVCEYDDTFQSFQTCIDCHEAFGERNCHAPVELLKMMRDNQKTRRSAGWSASTLTSCARATALLEVYEYYEPPKSGYNKSRGSWVHAVMESDPDPPEEVIRERRLRKYIWVTLPNGKRVKARLTGQPDKVYRNRGILMDYKSKDRLPKGPDISHEAQFNVYAWLLKGGYFLDANGNELEQCDVTITKGGMHYLTWNPKAPYLKFAYNLWSAERTEAFVKERLTPLLLWRETGTLPSCNAFLTFPGKWRCDCVKITEQLAERGIEVEEQHDLSGLATHE